MKEFLRKKSPRAPSVPLADAIAGAIKIYEKEHRHPAPVEIVAQHLGYKGANNGAALKLIASIRYYGLLERPADGELAVSKDVEAYHFAPSEEVRSDLLRRWVKTPPVFAELLDKYPDALPSDKTLRYDLIQRGFLPDGADSVVSVFRDSVDLARYYAPSSSEELVETPPPTRSDHESADTVARFNNAAVTSDRIPIRLPGGRRAFVEIPSPFYAADKERIKKQIDLLLTQEDEAAEP
jgi:hypothetical protein